MPTSPEFMDGSRKIWAVKVGHKVDIKKLCTSDGDIRIPGEVTVYLNREKEDDKYQIKTMIALNAFICGIYVCTDDIGNDKLFVVADQHKLCTVHGFIIVKLVFGTDLRQKI